MNTYERPIRRIKVNGIAGSMRCIDKGLGHILIRHCDRAIRDLSKFGGLFIEDALHSFHGLSIAFDGCCTKEASVSWHGRH